MFYKPKFCCNCGEKIERIDWSVRTSRRFCDVCAIEQQGYELAPRVIIGAALLFGTFGIGSHFYERSPDLSRTGSSTIGSSSLKRSLVDESNRQPTHPDPRNFGLEIGKSETQVVVPSSPDGPAVAASKEQPKIRKVASDEPVYFCGAMTKKGKPCSRRVKSSNERCWQHAGQPSAVSARRGADVF